MRTMWKGAISFGLVSIPVKVVSATESHAVSFRQVHTADQGQIRYRKVCELEDEEVPAEEIGRAYQTADGSLVQVTDADLAELPLPTAKTVDILGFVPLDSIDPYQFDRSYYLTADPGAAKPYVLLREALRRAEKGAVAKLAMRGRETLALVRTLDDQDVLGMHTLLWPDEIRSAEGLAPTEQVTVRDTELDLADTLMDTLGPVDMAALHDEYRAAVEELISAKLTGVEVERPPVRAPGKVIDLMAALEDSVRTARESRGQGAEATVTPLSRAPKEEAAPSERAAKKKTAQKKTTAKKAAGETTGEKKGQEKAGEKTSAAKKKSAGRRRAR